MTHRWPIIGATIVVALLVATGAVFLAMERRAAELASRESAALAELAMVDESATADETDRAEGLAPATADVGGPVVGPDDVFVEGDVVFVSRIPGDAYGSLGSRTRDGERRSHDLDCERVHAMGGVLLCLESAGLLAPAGTATVHAVTDETFPELWQRPSGRPSRARVAPDGERFAFTGFVAGHSYLDVGEFATETVVATTSSGGMRAEHLMVDSDDPRFRAIDGNWWGVSFEPGAMTALLTHGTGSSVEIVRADFEAGTVTPTGIVGGCPSVSPSGRFVVVKRPDPRVEAQLALILHDLDTGQERLLNEARFVDDQVEWLDDDTVLYALERGDDDIQPTFDIWALDVDADAEPRIFVPYADSPAVYRDER